MASENAMSPNHDYAIQPIEITSPIEGILISEEEKRIAPILQIKMMEGLESMIGT